jgi:hypothetical protein
LGNIQQQDHLIVYDLDEAQIGFQSTSCWLLISWSENLNAKVS